MKNTNTNTTSADALTVDALTPRKAEQRKAQAAGAHAYGAGAPYTFDDIRTAYSKPSTAKIAAWERCKALCASFNGEALRITGKNSMKFFAVFRYIETATGAICYCYITPSYTRHAYA